MSFHSLGNYDYIDLFDNLGLLFVQQCFNSYLCNKSGFCRKYYMKIIDKNYDLITIYLLRIGFMFRKLQIFRIFRVCYFFEIYKYCVV